MSELLDKQAYVQIEILKITFQGSRKPTKKCAMKMKVEKKTDNHIIFVEEFIRLYQKSGGTNFN